MVHSTELKRYIKCVRYCLEYWVPEHSQIHRSFKFAFDPGDFVCDLSKIVPRDFDRTFDGSGGGRWAGEVESDSG